MAESAGLEAAVTAAVQAALAPAITAAVQAGAEPVAMSPEEFGKFLQNEITKWRETIKKAGIQAD